jgi:fructose-1,6-bisphosphatase
MHIVYVSSSNDGSHVYNDFSCDDNAMPYDLLNSQDKQERSEDGKTNTPATTDTQLIVIDEISSVSYDNALEMAGQALIYNTTGKVTTLDNMEGCIDVLSLGDFYQLENIS